MNEVTPDMLNQAHILGGGRRGPTKAEMRDMQKGNFFAALTHIAGTATSTLLEAGVMPNIASGRGLIIAKAMLAYAEKSMEEEEWEVSQLRQLRNQMAAQLIYSTLRSNPGADTAKLISDGYEAATYVVKGAEELAEKFTSEMAD